MSVNTVGIDETSDNTAEIDKNASVNIAGIDKVALLRSLWTGRSPARYFRDTGTNPPSFEDDDPNEAVKYPIDYFSGRCIKCDLSKETVLVWGYDMDMGHGAFQKIVDSIRSAK
jgi:hypothetical protein